MVNGMDIARMPVLEAMRERMSWLSQRQTVLAENVANANTPEYRARDLEAPDFAAMARGEGRGGLVATNARHFTGGGIAGGGVYAAKDMPDAETTPNGNSVVLEDQMMKVAEVQADFSTVTTLYRKALNLIRIAAGAGGR